tara:strand:+ start:7442 stop:8569 length:1128 start_codon:yes stop_codon:yes gene_type:complete
VTRISILGTVGIPANYGGFETLAENLARYHQDNNLPGELMVYCSARSYPEQPYTCLGARLRYINLNANGVSSVPYDVISLFSAIVRRTDVIVLLGVSGAIALPLVRLLSRAKIITNIDGIEWKRAKWKGLARWFLHYSEKLAVRFSHEVIADNGGIAQHVQDCYGRDCHVIAYGGDHAVSAAPKPWQGTDLPARYALSLCRIEPENNVDMILDAFSGQNELSLVFVGNWNNSAYGRELKQHYAAVPHLQLLDPVYDIGVLHTLRCNAVLYVHGHSAGGTNPSLVEMMHFGLPVLAYDCVFNRHTTEQQALFFSDAEALCQALQTLTPAQAEQVGVNMLHIAQARYTWDVIGAEYFRLAGVLEYQVNPRTEAASSA